MVKLLVVSDTHAPRRWKAMPAALVPAATAADVILHAGDVCTVDVLETLATFAPVYAVLGNNDGTDVADWGAPERRVFDVGGFSIAMVHDSGARQGRGRRMRRWFPEADLVVFGHSHIPVDVVEDGVHLFNPGSPTDRRRQPVGTYGWLEITDGRLTRHEIMPLPVDNSSCEIGGLI